MSLLRQLRPGDIALKRWLDRRPAFDPALTKTVADIIAEVDQGGAAAVLHGCIGSNPGPGRELAEAYYLLGITEARIGRNYWVTPAPFLLETAIRQAPQEPFARIAFETCTSPTRIPAWEIAARDSAGSSKPTAGWQQSKQRPARSESPSVSCSRSKSAIASAVVSMMQRGSGSKESTISGPPRCRIPSRCSRTSTT